MESSRVKHDCPLCHCYAAPTMKAVVRHIGAVHGHDHAFYVCCGVQGCPRTYHHFHSYKNHMYKKHKDVLDDSAPMQPPQSSSTSMSCNIGTGDGDSEECTVDDDVAVQASQMSDHEMQQSALFLMKAKEVNKVSQSSLNELVGDITLMLERQCHKLESSVSAALAERGIEMDPELHSLFHRPDVIAPFQGLETEYLQKKFYREKFGLLEPVERKLGHRIIPDNTDSTRHHKRVSDYMYEVPLLSSLQKLLSDQHIREDVLRGHKRNDGLLADYCDGSSYRSHPLFSRCPEALQIMAYYDDVEVCNPLGSKAKKHKLALFYYLLGNISPKYRSSLRCIQLLAVMKSSVLQQYGSDLILKNVMKDVKQLEKDAGVAFELDGVEYTFRGTFSLLPADNLASQYLGGYKALNAALRKCRNCMAVDGDMQTLFVSEAFQSRTRETHAAQCASLGGHLHEHYATTYGLHRDTILNTSRYFHVTEGLVPDIMHDVLEGVLQLETKELLKCLVQNKVISASDLEQALTSFPYTGPDSKNKPTPIVPAILSSKDHSLKQSATQMWCLARLLPLMVGEKVDEDNTYWMNFLLLLSIVDYVFAPIISKDSVAYVRTLIDEHHQAFKELYPHCRITPKMHYMVHYPECMQRFGPLVRFWCMRFEGKHNYFKDLAHRVKSFKNIPKTMATRHQHLAAYSSRQGFSWSPFCKDAMVGRASEVAVCTLKYTDTLLSTIPECCERDEITKISWVQIDGTTYNHGDIVVLASELVPTFGIIEDIIVIDVDIYYLVCEVLQTECFVEHFHSFEVTKVYPPEYDIRKAANLFDHHVLSSYRLSSYPHSSFVPLKYHLIENI